MPYPPVADGKAVTMYQEKEGIEWNGLQLVDLLLPALSAVETVVSDDAAIKVR